MLLSFCSGHASMQWAAWLREKIMLSYAVSPSVENGQNY